MTLKAFLFLHRIGPGRVWVETARDLAGRGVEVIRYDRRGTGDTGLATAEFPPIYSRIAKEDVRQAISATGTPPDRLMMTGVCSGAWSSACSRPRDSRTRNQAGQDGDSVASNR